MASEIPDGQINSEEIRAVIFDIGDVVLTGLLEAQRRMSALLGVPEGVIAHGLRGEGYVDLNDLFVDRIDEDQFIARVLSKNGWSLSPTELKGIIRNNFLPVEGTREIVLSLRGRGLRTGLLSDHCREWVRYCDGMYHHHDLFDEQVYSFDLGVTKPDERMFKSIAEKLQSDPKECLFIDDSEVNVAGARQVGMRAIRFRDAQTLRRDLAAMGLVVD